MAATDETAPGTVTADAPPDALAVLEEIRGFLAARDALVERMASAPVGVGEWNAATDRLAKHVPTLLAGYDALLAEHGIVQLYESAEACRHGRPPCTSGCVEDECECPDLDEWLSDHPFGTTGERICTGTPVDKACVRCTEMVYGDEPTTDDYTGCLIRCVLERAIAAALLTEEVPAVTTQPAIPFPPPSFTHHAYGVDLDWFGDDGGMIARGHVSDLRFAAACNRLARTEAGLVNVMDEHGASLDAFLAEVTRVWAVPSGPVDGCGWALYYGREITGKTPGAIPVTVMLP